MTNSNYTTIPILERTDTIINLIAGADDGLSSAEILNALDIPKTTLYRILNFLLSHGYIQLNPVNNHYYIGIKFSLLSKTLEEQLLNLKVTAQPFLQKLADITRQTAKISILSGQECFVILKSESRQQIKVTVNIGAKFPLHAGAASKILLSSLSDIEIQKYFASPVPQYTHSTIAAYESMIDELAQIRTVGYACDNGEFIENISAIAAPIYNVTNQIIAAVSIAFPTASLDSEQLSFNITHTTKTAQCISEALHHPSL